MKIIIWGTGKILEKYINRIDLSNVLCFVDSNCEKQEMKYMGKDIISPQEIRRYSYDFITISSTKYFNEISKQIIYELGISVYKVINLNYYLQICGKEIISISEDMKDLILAFCKKNEYYSILDADAYLQRRIWSQDIKIDAYYTGNRKMEISFLYSKVWNNYKDINGNYDLAIIMKTLSLQQLIKYFDKFKYILVFMSADMEHFLEESKEIIWEKCNIKGYLFALIIHKSEDVAIYEITHKKFMPINESSYIPLYVGKKTDENLEYMTDNCGKNISIWNDKINECTGLYWIWKNTEHMYVGLNHYRRFFLSPLNKHFMLQKWEIRRLMELYDIVVAKQVNHGSDSVKESLCSSIDGEAFNVVYTKIFDIFEKRTEQERTAFHYVFEGSSLFPCNMFITSREILNDYCSWLFPILKELIETVEIKEEWDNYSKRVIGFFAERLLTVWLVQHKYKIKELPVVLVGNEGCYGK